MKTKQKKSKKENKKDDKQHGKQEDKVEDMLEDNLDAKLSDELDDKLDDELDDKKEDDPYAKERVKFVFFKFFIPQKHAENIKKMNFQIDEKYFIDLTKNEVENIPDAFVELSIAYLAKYFDTQETFSSFRKLVEIKKNLLKQEEIAWSCNFCKLPITAFCVSCEWCRGWYHADKKKLCGCSPGYQKSNDKRGKKKWYCSVCTAVFSK